MRVHDLGTNVTSGAETIHPSVAHEFTFDMLWGWRCRFLYSVLYIIVCHLLLFVLVIALSCPSIYGFSLPLLVYSNFSCILLLV
jgi:hypothetical protein